MPPAVSRRGMLASWSLLGNASLSWSDPSQIGKGDPGGNAIAVGLFTALTGLTIPVGTDLIQTSGYNLVGRGAARYALDPDQITIVASTTRQMSLNGRWFKLCEDRVSLAMVGAMGDGLTDDTAAIAAASALCRALCAPPGRYLIEGNLAITSEIAFDIGATFAPTAGVTVGFHNWVNAGLHHIFDLSLGGLVTFLDEASSMPTLPVWWGAVVNNNAVDCSAAFSAAAAAAQTLRVSAGTYLIGSNIALSARVVFDFGAILKVSNGVTVTFNEGVQAGIYQIFNCIGTGAVVFSPRTQSVGYPEWWGAVTGNPAIDCQPAMAACFAAVQTTQLQAADYYVQSTPQFNYSCKNLFGAGSGGTNIGIGVAGAFPLGEPGATQVILTGIAVKTDLVFQIGYTRAQLGVPADNATIMRNSTVRDILFARDCSVYQVNPATTADPLTSVWGVAVTFMSGCLMERLKSFNSPVGFRYEGCVTTTIRDCNAAIVNLPSGAANKFFVGHLVGGYVVNYGYIGANASIYLDHCTSFDAPAGFTTTWGMRVFGAFADTFIHKFEDARHDIGLEFDGRDAGGGVMNISGSQQDVKASDIVCDGNGKYSLYIHDTNDWCSIMLNEPYLANTSAVTYACTIINVAGVVEMTMGYILEGTNYGISATNTNGFSIRGTLIRDSGSPVVLNNVGYSLIEPRVFNLGNRATSAVSLVGCFRNVIRPQVTEAGNLLTYGISLDNASTYNAVDPTMIQFDAMVAPSNATLKVRFNGADASPGGAGNAAFLAAHNVLTGVTG